MSRFDRETALIALELQQILANFAYEMDFTNCRKVADFYAEDGVFAGGNCQGREAIRKYYAEREVRVAAQHKDGIRVAVHTFLNVRFEVEGKERATARFIGVSYAGEGQPPVRGAINPAVITDCRIDFQLDADGNWLIKSFTGTPLFVGTDPFVLGMMPKR